MPAGTAACTQSLRARSHPHQATGELTTASEFSIEPAQRDAWLHELEVLRSALTDFAGRGHLHLEFVVPRLGKRIDAVAVIDHMVFIIEFKIGAGAFARQDPDQVWDYALDLKNFHETSHTLRLLPVLVITGVRGKKHDAGNTEHRDGVVSPVAVSADWLAGVLHGSLGAVSRKSIVSDHWHQGRYKPTPTIVEAAAAATQRHPTGLA